MRKQDTAKGSGRQRRGGQLRSGQRKGKLKGGQRETAEKQRRQRRSGQRKSAQRMMQAHLVAARAVPPRTEGVHQNRMFLEKPPQLSVFPLSASRLSSHLENRVARCSTWRGTSIYCLRDPALATSRMAERLGTLASRHQLTPNNQQRARSRSMRIAQVIQVNSEMHAYRRNTKHTLAITVGATA